MTFAERLRSERERLDLTQPQVAEITGVTKKSVGVYEAGKVSPPCDFIEKLIPYGFNYKYIMTGEKVTENTPFSDTEDFIMIPMVEARLSAGGGSFETSNKITREYAFKRDFIERKGNAGNMVIMRVSGDSMEPEILDNDVVLIDQSKNTVLANKIYAVAFGECIYLKRIDMLPNQVVLKSSNKNYSPIYIDMNDQTENQFKVIGRVLWSGREYF